MAGDAVHRNRERIGEDRLLVGHRIGDREQHRVVRRHQLAEPTRHVFAHSRVDARRDRTDAERPTLAQVARSARGTPLLHAPRPTREPGIQHHAIADGQTFGFRSDLHHVGHDLVAHHMRKRHEVLHGVVAERSRPFRRREAGVVEERLLRFRPTDPDQPRLGHHPVGREQSRWIHLDDPHRCRRQHLEVAILGLGFRDRLRLSTEEECKHRRSV